jgi:selenocysteine lyase/cysteine desulfurase
MLMPARGDFGALRDREFARLDATGCTYLDYAGAALVPRSLVVRDARRLTRQVMANPHSESDPSRASTEAIEGARRRTLEMVDADPDRYDVVFTANASAALRIIAEAFPFRAGSRLVLTADNHNSVNGLRIRARRRGATVVYTALDEALRAIDPFPSLPSTAAPSLFAFPAQSNFSGVRHPLGWVEAAQARGYRVLLDAAAHLPTSRLSLRETPADFVALSFYKIFGYPTGVGALVVARDALASLRRSYFAGGTVLFASVQNQRARMRDGAASFEDGTPNFLSMPSVCDGLQWFREAGIERIHDHVARLTASLLDRLSALGDRVIVYGPRDMTARGGTIAFNLRRGGRIVDHDAVERSARDRGIAVRAGCFCNPGAAEHALRIDPDRARKCSNGAFSLARYRECLGDAPVGAVRASVGVATCSADLDRLAAFLADMTSGSEPAGQ